MRNTINRTLSVMMLCSTILASSCASWALGSPPKLELRTLRLSRKGPYLEYQYKICVRRKLGICLKHGMKVEKYDLTKQEVRNQIVDTGFVMRVREQP